MPVPEAAVNENDLSPARKNDIRLSRKVLPVKAEPVAKCVEFPADNQLRPCVLGLDRPHNPTSLLDCASIDHGSLVAAHQYVRNGNGIV